MSSDRSAHLELLAAVSKRLESIAGDNDFEMLSKWRSLTLCQYLLCNTPLNIEAACVEALDCFAQEGLTDRYIGAMNVATSLLKRAGFSYATLPEVASTLQVMVDASIADIGADASVVTRANALLPKAEAAVRNITAAAGLPGISYRFGKAAEALGDPALSDPQRRQIAAAILYVDEIKDVVPDSLGAVGMLDDDYALRRALHAAYPQQGEMPLHWTERIASLWDSLPFLTGVNLRKKDERVSVTWFDRSATYVIYRHIMSKATEPLLLVMPSPVFSPLHATVSLMGLLVLDAVTGVAPSQTKSLLRGQVYELDGSFVRYQGLQQGDLTPGWLRLEFSNCVHAVPPGLADRMVATSEKKLTKGQKYEARKRHAVTDPIQRFLGWDAAINPRSLQRSLILVISGKREQTVLAAVESNGVSLLSHGLIRNFQNSVAPDTRGVAVHVVRNVADARSLLEQGVLAEAVLIDSVDKLHKGRNDLCFLNSGGKVPSVVAWCLPGDLPDHLPDWLSDARRLGYTPDDLSEIIECDGDRDDVKHRSIRQAAKGADLSCVYTSYSAHEQELLTATAAFTQDVRRSNALSAGMKMQLGRQARALRLLISATPAIWVDIANQAAQIVLFLRKHVASPKFQNEPPLLILAQRLQIVCESAGELVNSQAAALLSNECVLGSTPWTLVCDIGGQVEAAEKALRHLCIDNVTVECLSDVRVLSQCIVAGWSRRRFAQGMFSRTPTRLLIIANHAGHKSWSDCYAMRNQNFSTSLLEEIGGHRPRSCLILDTGHERKISTLDEDEPLPASLEGSRGCDSVLVWLANEQDVKVLAPEDTIFVEIDDGMTERRAENLVSGDTVILGRALRGSGPGDDFVDMVLDAVRRAHPELVKQAKEWREALVRYQLRRQLDVSQLQAILRKHGIERGPQTISAWLDVDRDGPIAPQRLPDDLEALWLIIEQDARASQSEVLSACRQLRRQCNQAAKGLVAFYGRETGSVGSADVEMSAMVNALRGKARVCEVEATVRCKVPESLLGWWISEDFARTFAH